MNRVPLPGELRVHRTRALDHEVGEAAEERRLETDRAALLDGAAHDPPEYVAAVLVGGHDTVGDQERHRAAVIGEHPQRTCRRLVLSVPAARELLAVRDQWLERVAFEDGWNVLKDRREPLEAGAGVDVLLRQRLERTVLLQRVLHEDEVPELEEALVVAAGQIVRSPVVEPAVEVELRARPAGADRAGLPEVLRPGSCTILSAGTPTDRQHSIASSSGPRPSSGSPSKTVIQICSGSSANPSVDSSHANSTAPCLK